ncbi:uncharacterized protein K02A2.6-like [Planococcus citri]|uniref:uncharacterized protein K02A2.6-like n=1 Tax=Planococcus citri TaxID=170843 RepID=UPI0031F8C526
MDGAKVINPFPVSKANAQEWEQWKSVLEFYFTSEKITDAKAKQAKLILLGGKEIQELYFSFPKVTQYPTGYDEYTYTIDCLDGKLGRKSTKWYERYILAKMSQGKEERFASFVTRVRNQALKCDYTTEEQRKEAVQLQIILGCQSNELRTELLRTKATTTLETFEEMGQTSETVSQQANVIGSSATASMPGVSGQPDSSKLCKVDDKRKKAFRRGKSNSKQSKVANGNADTSPRSNKDFCYGCGYEKHTTKDLKCPAANVKCSKCNRVGHYSKMCKSAPQQNSSASDGKSKVKMVGIESYGNNVDEPIFCVRSDERRGDEIVPCEFGGVNVEMFIDSGSAFSIVSYGQWRKIRKSSKFKVVRFLPKPDIVFGDGSGQFRYNVRSSALVEIVCNNRLCIAEVIIIDENLPLLLGSEDAKALGVLKVGLQAAESERIRVISDKKATPLGKLKDFQLHIPINPEVSPVAQPMYRLPYGLRPAVEQAINELLELDVIEPVSGPTKWVSPIVLEPKSDDTYRLCVDCRRVNKAVLCEKHPIPVLEEMAPQLKEATVFSKVDLYMAYRQVELDLASREITTFSTHLGLFRCKRLIEGLKSAAEQFQKILESILAGLRGQVNFIDDIVVFGKDKEEHDRNLKAVLDRLEEVGLSVNMKKSKFGQSEITFLGHVIGHGMIKPTIDKVEAIREFRLPETSEELKSFLGLVSYVGKFIPNLSTELDVLRRVSRSVPFEWSGEAVQHFLHVRSLLSDESHLYLYDPDLPTIVMADASPVGLGAVLLQKKGEENRVICYVSRSLTDVERRYSQTEKEALALVYAVERLKYYLIGHKFELITDHKPLEVIFGPKSKPCARIERWVLRLQAFDYVVKYAPGKNNIADPLSRLLQVEPPASSVNQMYEKNLIGFVEHLVPRAVTLRDIREATKKDPELSSICDDLLFNRELKVKPYSAIATELCVVSGVLLRGNRIVVPSDIREQILSNAHEGHPGISKTKERLRTKVWWPGIDAMAEKYVRSCDSCQKVDKSITIEQMARRKLPDGPWQDLAIDFKSLPASKQHLCVVVDYFSRYVEAIIMNEISAESTVEFLTDIFARHGVPYSITSDNGAQFTSAVFKNFCLSYGIVSYTSPPYWPQANGEIERQNRSLSKVLKVAQLKNESVKRALVDYLLMYRSTPHSVTGKSPAELLFGRKMRDKLPTLKERVEEIAVRDADAYSKGKSLLSTNANRVSEKNLAVGDEVLIERPFTRNKGESKFAEETGTVIAVHGPEVIVRTPHGDRRKHKNQVERYDRRSSGVNVEGVQQSSDDDSAVIEPASASAEGSELSTTTSVRPSREVKKPTWLKDYV